MIDELSWHNSCIDWLTKLPLEPKQKMELVKVYSSVSINEVNYIRTYLEANGIDAVIFDEATAAIAPHLLFYQGGSRVMVRDSDFSKANEIIKDYEKFKKERIDN